MRRPVAGLAAVLLAVLLVGAGSGAVASPPAAAAVAADADCAVDDASLTWGFKESFRSYISGSIANGEWTVADGATYNVPDFGWSAGSGGVDPVTGDVALGFTGSIAFTGHSGALSTTVSNPRLRFDVGSAILLLDVSGTTQDGAVVDSAAVEFAELDLAAALENEGGSVRITDAPAALTAAGAAAFGTYPEGEPLDPVSVAFSTGVDCAIAEWQQRDAPTAEPETDSSPAAATTDLGWIVGVALVLLVVAAALVAVVLVRRRVP